MQLDYAIEGYWLAKRRDFSASIPHHPRPSQPAAPAPARSSAYTEAEIRELLAACDKSAGWDRAHSQRMEVKRPPALHDRALMLVLLDAGIRASELTALKLRYYEPKWGRSSSATASGTKSRSFSSARPPSRDCGATWPPGWVPGKTTRSLPPARAR